MTGVDAVAQFRQLQAAALAVLDRADKIPEHPEPFRTALDELRRCAAGAPSADADTSSADPSSHLMSLYRYEGTEKRPIGLDEEAGQIRRELAGDRTPASSAPAAEQDFVVLTELRAMIIGSLLQELAARLTPGAAFGPGTGGQNLAAVVSELAQELLDQTFVGHQ